MNLTAPLVLSDLADTSTRGKIDAMLQRLDATRRSNQLKQAYYDFEARIPRSPVLPIAWQEARQVCGWPATVIDVLEERLDLLGWRGDKSGTLEALFRTGGIDLEATLGHLDALLYGVAFLQIDPHAVADGRPDLVTAASPLTTTGIWDGQRRRLVAALTIVERDNTTDQPRVIAYADDEVTGSLQKVAGVWRWVDRRLNPLGRTPVVQMVNRPRASRLGGRSEITRPVRSYTDQAVQTLAGMRANRDFYAYPQRWAENAPDDLFADDDGTPKPGWVTAMAAMLTSGQPGPGQQPVRFGSFASSPPTPFLDQISGLATQLAGEAAIPPHYFGLLTDNPASAEAIRNIESRLVKRTERRQTSFGWAWREVGTLVLAAHGQDANGISVHWRAADTPTVAAEADATVKLVQAGVLPPRSSVTYDRLRITPEDQKQIASDWVSNQGPLAALASAVTRQAGPADGAA
ncbi:MAG: phage portal protein [Propioniciclava sp.]|uniref:phage portal protein n=1 Tax=Propioniciclava sp. TaxID=2038686 RepID=UPI0039E4B5B4